MCEQDFITVISKKEEMYLPEFHFPSFALR